MRIAAIIVLTAIAALISALPGDYAGASEIVLKRELQCKSPVVTLGHIAEVIGADSQLNQQLAAVELFPAPAQGRQRFVRVREIQDILVRRGVNLTKHRFSGSSQIALSRAGRVEQATYEKPIHASARRSTNRRVTEAVLDHLRSSVSGTKSWNVDLSLSPEQLRRLQGPVRKLRASGGAAPWNGPQQFVVTAAKNDGRPLQISVEAHVSLPPSVVVANRDIPRDTLITAADLALSSEVPRNAAVETFSSIEDIAGRQATRTISAGAIVQQQWIRHPLLVRRSEIVTITARAAGVRVSTNARARSDGSLGDVITVESLQDRKTYYARVCGSREAEVYSPTVRTRRASTSARPSAASRQPRHTQLSQPRSAQNKKLNRIQKGTW